MIRHGVESYLFKIIANFDAGLPVHRGDLDHHIQRLALIFSASRCFLKVIREIGPNSKRRCMAPSDEIRRESR